MCMCATASKSDTSQLQHTYTGGSHDECMHGLKSLTHVQVVEHILTPCTPHMPHTEEKSTSTTQPTQI